MSDSETNDFGDLSIDEVPQYPEVLLGERLNICFLAAADIAEALQANGFMTTRVKKKLSKGVGIIEKQAVEMVATVDMLNMLVDVLADECQIFRDEAKDPPLLELARLIEYCNAELCTITRYLVPDSLSPDSLLRMVETWSPRVYAVQETHPHLWNSFYSLRNRLTTLSEDYATLVDSLSLTVSQIFPACTSFLCRIRRTPTISKCMCIGRALWKSLARPLRKSKMDLYAAHLQAMLQLEPAGVTGIELAAVYVMLVPITLEMKMRCDESEACGNVLVVMACVQCAGRRTERADRLRRWCQKRFVDDRFEELEEEADGQEKLSQPITITATEEELSKLKKKKNKKKRKPKKQPPQSSLVEDGEEE